MANLHYSLTPKPPTCPKGRSNFKGSPVTRLSKVTLQFPKPLVYPFPKPSFLQLYREIYQAKHHSHFSNKVQTPLTSVFNVEQLACANNLIYKGKKEQSWNSFICTDLRH